MVENEEDSSNDTEVEAVLDDVEGLEEMNLDKEAANEQEFRDEDHG